MPGRVVAVSRCGTHSFSKNSVGAIRLVTGSGVEGDAHAGITVKHRSRVARDPTRPNLRQVHLLHEELLSELRSVGYTVEPGQLGENVTTCGIDLLGLPTGARLLLGTSAIVEVTGLRNPCRQIDDFRPGLMSAVLGRDAQGNLVRKAGIMAIVVADGVVVPGDPIAPVLPPGEHRPLEPV